jgi:hypothetical protein
MSLLTWRVFGVKKLFKFLKLKRQTERVGFEKPEGLIKVGRSVSALIETGVEKLA